jgi:hypothetical protein
MLEPPAVFTDDVNPEVVGMKSAKDCERTVDFSPPNWAREINVARSEMLLQQYLPAVVCPWIRNVVWSSAAGEAACLRSIGCQRDILRREEARK